MANDETSNRVPQRTAAPATTPLADEATGPPPARLAALSLAALGVVYGDIGTSPLYAFREALRPVGATPESVLGILSLIFWSLTLVVSIKYLLFVMRADNHGEGGILALLAVLRPRSGDGGRKYGALIALGVFGAALLYGDGIITPAISVLSAVEGLGAAAPALHGYIVPITIGILLALFAFQRAGTARVGGVFGPVMVLWFAVLAVLGAMEIARNPAVLVALDPMHGVAFLLHHRTTGLVVLGAVFLVVTGSEALYADMGHFGRRPIRLAWFGLAFPALVLNYFGQGALVLRVPAAAAHPFFHLAPGWATFPLIALAGFATVIASQAVISGAFSLTRQAVQLGHSPRVAIVQTSSEESGQVYVPVVNIMLSVLTIALVLGFRSSANLAAAYGVAISTTMVITTLLAFFLVRDRWRWHPLLIAAAIVPLLVLDLAFFGTNIVKIAEGGWFPLTVGAVVYVLMSTWRRGRAILAERLEKSELTIDEFLEHVRTGPVARVPGAAVFLAQPMPGVPAMMMHHLQRNQVLHRQAVILTVVTDPVPRVPAAERLVVKPLADGIWRVYAHYGFMQSPDVPVVLRLCESQGLKVDLDHATFYLGRATLIPSARIPGMSLWRERLFVFLSRNASDVTTFYRLPAEQVVELGIRVEL